jgi:hypothetical protein
MITDVETVASGLRGGKATKEEAAGILEGICSLEGVPSPEPASAPDEPQSE